MKKVLIPLAINNRDDNACAPLHFVRESYLLCLAKNNLFPVLVPVISHKEVWEQAYKESGGVLLTGGSDVNPQLYGKEEKATVHPETYVHESVRDHFEIEIARRAIQDRKPIFAICRGCQVLAIASGGTLHQHIPDIVPAEKEKHTAKKYAELYTTPTLHEVILDPKSNIYAILKKEKIMANSAHHQAVKTVGSDFIISGKTENGIVEIIEHKDKGYFCFGMQGHPEAGNTELKVLFKKFSDTIR